MTAAGGDALRGRPRRSYLYVPGDTPRRFEKALSSGADVLILDLEDAVDPARKPEARQAVRDWLLGLGRTSQEIWVRLNSGEARAADLTAIRALDRLDGVVLAKADSAEDVESAATGLDRLGLSRVKISPLIESGAAVLDVRRIAEHPRTFVLQLGEHDLAADLGIPPDAPVELDWPRSFVVLASAAAGLDPPIAPVAVEIADLASFRASTSRAAWQGFVGRACIHPAQVPIVNEIFTPTPAALERAREVLAAFDRALTRGVGVAVDGDGRMMDAATVRRARRVLALSDESAV